MIDASKMNVMIADDTMAICDAIFHIMQAIGYGDHFIFAHNGKEAWELVQKEPVDLALLDYDMPHMTGGEVLRNIREDRKLRDLPVIIVSAIAERGYIVDFGELEIDAFIVKPFTTNVVKEKVAHVVEKVNNPSPMVAHLIKARDFEKKGNLDAAIKETELAAEANPKASRPMRELGCYYFKKNDLRMSEKWLLKALAMNGLDVTAFHHLGELYLKINDIEKASECFEKAMSINPRHISRGISLGKILVQRKMFDKAIPIFDKVLKLPGCSLDLREEIADFCLEEGVNEYGIALLESLAEESNRRAPLFSKLGKAWESIGNTLKAVSYFTQAADSDNNNIDIRIHLANLYLHLQKPILAERVLAEVLKIDNEHEQAKELIKACHERG